MADNKDVMVLAEITEGNLSSISTELLGCGRRLADELGQRLTAVLLGSNVNNYAREVIARGSDNVYVVESEMLGEYQADAYVTAMEKVVEDAAPTIILMGHTSIGSDVAPRLAYNLKTKATLDCVALEIEPVSGRLLKTKPVYGGNANAVYVTDTDPQIVTVRAKTMTPLEKDDSRTGEVINIDAGLDPSVMKTKLLEKVKEEIEGIKLEDAAVVIAGGRGIGGEEGFRQLEELAKMLKGAVGATRPACDAGWISDKAQIGLTSKIVSPDLYIAVGISGASQHMSGCSGSKTIIAINKDPDANIFRMAHYGIVGDWKKVMPSFISKVSEFAA